MELELAVARRELEHVTKIYHGTVLSSTTWKYTKYEYHSFVSINSIYLGTYVGRYPSAHLPGPPQMHNVKQKTQQLRTKSAPYPSGVSQHTYLT